MTGPGRSAPNSQRDTMLAESFVHLADTLVDDYDVVDLLNSLIGTCVDLLEATAAALMIHDPRGRLQVVASSSEESRLIELLQLQNDEGPCLDCVHTAKPVNVDVISAERDRWPRFLDAASRYGFTSVHALPMRLRQETIWEPQPVHHGTTAVDT